MLVMVVGITMYIMALALSSLILGTILVIIVGLLRICLTRDRK